MATISSSSSLPSSSLSVIAISEKLSYFNLYLNQPERALICLLCGYALQTRGQQASRHVGDKHGIPRSERKGLTALIQSLALEDPNLLPSREDWSVPHNLLLVSSGYACKSCDFRTTSVDLVQRHFSQDHGWKGSRKRDGWQQDHVHMVDLQSWSQNGRRKFWIVQQDIQTSDPVKARVSHVQKTSVLLRKADDVAKRRRANRPASQPAWLTEIHEEEQKWAGQQPFDVSPSSIDPSFRTNWMRRTGWDKMLEGSRRDILICLTRLPCQAGSALILGLSSDESGTQIYSSSQDEQRLSYLMTAVDRLFDRCEDTVRHTDYSLRFWLRSHEIHRPYKVPFELVSRPATVRTYRRLMKRLLCFVIRLWRIPPHTQLLLFKRSLTLLQSKVISQLWGDPIWVKLGLSSSIYPSVSNHSDFGIDTDTESLLSESFSVDEDDLMTEVGLSIPENEESSKQSPQSSSVRGRLPVQGMATDGISYIGSGLSSIIVHEHITQRSS